MTLAERIKDIRRHYRLTQQDFGEALGLRQGTIASYECGVREPSDLAINAICKEYLINKEWLLTGQGEMLAAHSQDEELALKLGLMLRDSGIKAEQAKHLINVILQMSSGEMETLQHVCEMVAGVAPQREDGEAET